MNRILAGVIIFWLASCTADKDMSPRFSIEPGSIQSGYDFLTAETQDQQTDAFSNPGWLWVEKGAELFRDDAGSKSCISCHTDPDTEFTNLVSRYPLVDDQAGLIGVENRINICRTQNQNQIPFMYESDELLSLTTYLKSISTGQVIDYKMSPKLRNHFESGQRYFYRRRGQLNLSCHQCHDNNWGAKMRGDVVSQGHINGFPAYRNDWQSLGSAHRRFEACDIGVRAEPHPLGSKVYLELEVYLMARGNGLKIETPAMRR